MREPVTVICSLPLPAEPDAAAFAITALFALLRLLIVVVAVVLGAGLVAAGVVVAGMAEFAFRTGFFVFACVV
ncbi:hypothetical protein AA101099_1171 [Neoasaia chiangmaiensis NBRC 101099]|nr:hypothetical protein AA101099_1171 [Neoasaia chiangmaiensis NBRC 101099]GEN15912.1 hypothetical protein NCH01_23430 [Neoasaia chiangmaiensis]